MFQVTCAVTHGHEASILKQLGGVCGSPPIAGHRRFFRVFCLQGGLFCIHHLSGIVLGSPAGSDLAQEPRPCPRPSFLPKTERSECEGSWCLSHLKKMVPSKTWSSKMIPEGRRPLALFYDLFPEPKDLLNLDSEEESLPQPTGDPQIGRLICLQVGSSGSMIRGKGGGLRILQDGTWTRYIRQTKHWQNATLVFGCIWKHSAEQPTG